MLNKHFINFCSNLRNGSRARKPYVIVKSNKLVLKVLKKLYQEGFINGYSIINEYEIKIYLKFIKDKGVLDYLELGGKIYRFKQLMYLKKGTTNVNYYMLFPSRYGLVNFSELVINSQGGLLLLTINIP